ncbi:MAG: hydantoinase/oxoprolinase family protein [Caldilineaceae bacterium SB0666_bin_21]|nr:hydantoinase/oxoprolinase family protein [Caldilineaceae bacterium SB0666_bin_21]
MHIAVDVGGTFTDVSILDEATGAYRFEKVETVPSDPASGVLAGLDKAVVEPQKIAYFIHGTTLGINALLTRTGANVAIVTTRGFRDVYELGRTDRDPMYDFKYRKPPALVPRHRVFEVEERLNFRGEILTPFNQDDALQVASRIGNSGAEAVAICFLHSYANQIHELAMQEALALVCPDLPVTLSSDLCREYREYERTSTAVVNAYIQPITRAYLGQLDGTLAEAGSHGQFLLTRSGGGVMTVASAQAEPVQLILSGPAAGVIGAAAFGEVIGVPNLITLDMGGTSLDTSLIVDGQPRYNNDQIFEGLPISKPAIDIHTIGAGGGSIAWVDAGGHLQVGPQSAGSVPGPVCYGKGGREITVTDAALTVGYLDPGNFLGGEMALQETRTHALLSQLAKQTGMQPLNVANGVLRISTVKIAGAVREISVEQGHHPHDFSLFAFGGGGPLLACSVARELGLPTVVVPPGAANFSAFGMLMVDVVHDFAQTFISGIASLQLDAVNRIRELLVQEARAALDADGIGPQDRRLEPFAEMRYTGQEHAVTIPLPANPLTSDDVPDLVARFNTVHERHYGHSMEDPVEIVTLRLRATGLLPRPDIPEMKETATPQAPRPKGSRAVAGSPVTYTVYERAALPKGMSLHGPAIVEEPTCTTVLHEDDILTVGSHGELHIAIG